MKNYTGSPLLTVPNYTSHCVFSPLSPFPSLPLLPLTIYTRKYSRGNDRVKSPRITQLRDLFIVSRCAARRRGKFILSPNLAHASPDDLLPLADNYCEYENAIMQIKTRVPFYIQEYSKTIVKLLFSFKVSIYIYT